MSSISFLCLIFVSERRWSRAEKTLKLRLSTVWSLFLFKYFLQSCFSFFRSFFSIFWSFSSISLFVFRNIHSLFLSRLRTRDASRASLCRKTLSSLFMISFSTDSFLLIHKVLLFCSFSCLVSSWFVRNSLRASQMRSDCLSTSCRSRSSHFDDLNE